MELNIFVTVLLTVLLVIGEVMYARAQGLEKIRAKVYEAFVEAEARFEHGENDAKLTYAVEAAQAALQAAPIPAIVKAIIMPFLTTENLKKILSVWYQQVKLLVQSIPVGEK